MGAFVRRPQAAHEVRYQLNSRFAPGDPLNEMVAHQAQFNIFHQNNSLEQIYKLLGVGPTDAIDRGRFFRFLDHLRTVPSDTPGENGHDRIVRARRENLEHATPLPMYTTSHRSADNPAVTVTNGYPVPHDHSEYVIISIPVEPDPPRPAAAAPAAMRRPRVRRSRPITDDPGTSS
jgi:hypothetical protein